MSGLVSLLLDPMIPGSGYINGLVGTLRAAPQIGAIAKAASQSLETETLEMRNLYKGLKRLKKELEKKDYDSVNASAKEARKLLQSLIKNEANYPLQFHGCPKRTPWAEYLSPLKNFDQALEHFLEDGFDATFTSLEEPLQQAQEFVQGEIKAQRGIAKKLLKKVARIAESVLKEKYGKLYNTRIENARKRLSSPPLIQLQKTIKRFRTTRPHPAVAEQELWKEIEILEKSHPRFKGIKAFVQKQLSKGDVLLDTIDGYVTTFIVHTFPEAKGFSSRKGLWEAALKVINQDQYVRARHILRTTEDTPLSERAEKVHQALALFSSREKKEKDDRIERRIKRIGDSLVHSVRQNLARRERRLFDQALKEHHEKLQSHDYEGALHALKKAFAITGVAQIVAKSSPVESPSSKVGRLVQRAEARLKGQNKTLSKEEWEAKIEAKKHELIESLTYFAAFKVVDNACHYTGKDKDPRAFQARYKQAMEEIADLPKEKKHTRFQELLKEKINEREELSFFEKFAAKQIAAIIPSLVNHFAGIINSQVADALQDMVENPKNHTLTQNSFVPYTIINRTLTSLLTAEERWHQETTSGSDDKTTAIAKILRNPKLNGGIDTDKLVQQVVNRALGEFLKTPSYQGIVKTLAGRLTLQNTEHAGILAQSLSGLIHVAAMGVAIPIYIAGALTMGLQRKAIPLVINSLGVTDNALASFDHFLAYDKRFAGMTSMVVLEQLKKVEEMLGKEGDGDGITVSAGEKEKAIVSELVQKLFHLVEKRKRLSPGQESRQDLSSSQLVETIHGATDQLLQNIIRDLTIFSFENLRKKDVAYQLIYSVLEKANEALQPNDESKIWQLYTLEEQERLGADRQNPKTVQRLEEEFEAENNGKSFSSLTPSEVNELLQQKYTNAEQKLQDTLGTILDTVVQKVVKDQANNFLKTPQDTVSDYATFLENALIPHKNAQREGSINYIREMRALARQGNLEEAQKKHLTFLKKIRKHLEEMKKQEEKDPKMGLEIQSLQRLTNRIMEHLTPLSEALVSEDQKEARKHLRMIERMMRNEELTLETVHYTLETKEMTTIEELIRKASIIMRKAAPKVSPFISKYVQTRLPVGELVKMALTTDSNTVKTLCREVTRLALED